MEATEAWQTHPSPAITIRPRSEDDDPTIISIRNAGHPWLPPTSVEEYRWQADPANAPPGQNDERWVAEQDGSVIGLYVLGESMFVAREHTFGANVGVEEAYRGRGVGSRLYDHLMKRAVDRGATRIYAQVIEDDQTSLSFAEHRGFRTTGRALRLSRLLLGEANLEGYDGLEEKLAGNGITFRNMEEIGMKDEPLLRRIFDLSFVSARDVPSSEEFQEIPYEVWLKWLTSPNAAPNMSWIAFDADRPVGVAMISRRGDSSGLNDYTGVDREYRGRGIARGLKLKTIESARENGIVSIFTANDFENKPMLSINLPLGYKAVPSELEIVKDL